MLLRQTLRTGLLKTVDEVLDTLQEDGKVRRFGILDGLQENLAQVQERGNGPLGLNLLEKIRKSATPPEPPAPVQPQLSMEELEAVERLRADQEIPHVGAGMLPYRPKDGRITNY